MSRDPSLTGKQLISLLKKKGFLAIRQKGIHVFMLILCFIQKIASFHQFLCLYKNKFEIMP